MSLLTIQVPEPHRAEFRRELLNLYAVKADALHHTASAYLSERGRVDRVHADQFELTALHSLIEQLGWRLDIPVRAYELTGEEYLIIEVVRAVFHRSVSELSDRAETAGSRPERIVDAVAPAIRRVSSAFGLVRQTYRPQA
jgi:hypothetical protein